MGPMGRARRRGRRRGLVVGAAVGATMANRSNNNDQSVQDDQIQADASAGSNDLSSQLKELESLKVQGLITEDEFQAKKKQILGL